MEILGFVPYFGTLTVMLAWYVPKWVKHYLSGKPKPAEEDKELQDLSDWKKWADQARDRKNKEFTEWNTEFQELLQKLCKHRYKDSTYRWWKCVDCAHEHEWKWRYDCTCDTNISYAIGGAITDRVPTYRDHNCPAHGRPRFVANEMYKRGKLTITESLLWDTEAGGHYLPSPAYDYWDKRQLERLTKAFKEARLVKATNR